ncbi:MAG: hypothetical protein M3Y80_01240, partial [Verrucomicrobiota bacterium]|nr:hypothetical protein [Verrucomicrobiota bacterium]
DWHLELFERPQDHAPRIGDPTPIICEITPRTQSAIFRDGTRIQNLTGFFRRRDLECEPTGHPARRVRITGYPLWDDEHNGAADVGTTIQTVGKNKYHQPWRSTAWEIHPVLKIEPADGASLPIVSAPTPPPPAIAPVAPAPPPAVATSAPAPAPPPPSQQVTLTAAVRVKIPYGETVLQPGMKLPLVSRDARTATLNYMGQTLVVPLQSTDLH